MIGKNRDKKETQQTHRCLFGNNFGRDLFNSVGLFLCFFPCRWKYFLSIICLFFTYSRGKTFNMMFLIRILVHKKTQSHPSCSYLSWYPAKKKHIKEKLFLDILLSLIWIGFLVIYFLPFISSTFSKEWKGDPFKIHWLMPQFTFKYLNSFGLSM